MRNTLPLKYILLIACVFGFSAADAAERIIRPRRTNRPAPKVAAPYAEDGTSQAPMAGLTPPDDGIWPSASPSLQSSPYSGTEIGSNTSKAYQQDGPNPPSATPARPNGGTGLAKNGKPDIEKQSEVGSKAEETVSEIDEGEKPQRKSIRLRGKNRPAVANKDNNTATEPGKARRGAKAADPDESGLPPYVSYDQYQDMNEMRQDFDAPMPHPGKKDGDFSPIPGIGQPPKYRELEELEKAPESKSSPARAESVDNAKSAVAAGNAAPTSPASQTAEAEAAHTINSAPPILYADGYGEPRMMPPAAQPTPSEVENYRRRLEFRLLERYNNLPEHAGQVAKVSVVLSKPLQPSLDGTRLRAEFDQLVYDPWGKRIPALEKEYYVVTFGSGGTRQVRSDPSVRVGLNLERTYSEPGPDIAEKVKSLPSDHAFRAAPSAEAPSIKMPDWWRPEFSADGY